jgi:hypothetical protein
MCCFLGWFMAISAGGLSGVVFLDFILFVVWWRIWWTRVFSIPTGGRWTGTFDTYILSLKDLVCWVYLSIMISVIRDSIIVIIWNLDDLLHVNLIYLTVITLPFYNRSSNQHQSPSWVSSVESPTVPDWWLTSHPGVTYNKPGHGTENRSLLC